MRYYISDCHFFHKNLNQRMDCRGFLSAEDMNEYMIKQWNSKVTKKDEVVVLGDFSVGKIEPTMEILLRLNGKICMIRGNHDYYLDSSRLDSSRFEWIRPYAEMHDNGRKVILSHYPIFCYNEQFRVNKDNKPRTYMLYGHVHNTYDEFLVDSFIKETRKKLRPAWRDQQFCQVNTPCEMINCFCMYSDYVPLSLDEWIELDEKRRKEIDEHILKGDVEEYFQWEQMLEENTGD